MHQYALPRNQGGGTRHVELFDRITQWETTFLAGDRNYQTGQRFTTEDSRFVLLRVPSHEGNGPKRVYGWLVFALKATLQLLRTPRIDAIYASTPQLLVPAAAAVIARLRKVPLVVEIRDLWPETLVAAGSLRRHSVIHRMLLALEKYVVRSAAHLVIVTPGWASHLAALGVDVSKVTCIPNGAEPPREDLTNDRDLLRNRHKIAGYTAVYAGAHGPANGLHQLLDAAALLPNVNFVLVGDGSQKEAVRAEADRLGLSNVSFRDPMPRGRLLEFLAAADVGIHCVAPLPVLQNGMSPNKVFDYLAVGLPVVSNAGTALSSVIADGEVGALVDPDSLVAGIHRVRAATDEERLTWARNAHTLLTERYSRTAAARSLEHVLNDVS